MKRLSVLAVVLAAHPAFAHHPGDRLDEVMMLQEPAFEVTDRSTVPSFDAEDQVGRPLRLDDFGDQILILSFQPRQCGDPCEKQQALLASTQRKINDSPMKEMVTFVTIQDPDASAEAQWDNANWRPMRVSGDMEVTDIANRFSALSDRDGTLPMAHLFDGNGRHAGIFHGANFHETNLVLYINGLMNNTYSQKSADDPSLWDRLLGFFE